MAETMKALVKAKPEPGVWMERVPLPEIGPTDVLIKIRKTAICGTDVHIYSWDDWSQKTIPVPMTIGHEYVGEIVEVGEEVEDFAPGDRVSGEGHIVCGHCRNCRAGPRAPLPQNGWGRREPARRLRRVSRNPGPQCLQAASGSARRHRGDPGSLRQRRPYGPLLRSGRRGRADHRRRADRHHGGGHRQEDRRAPHRHHRHQSLSPGAGAQAGHPSCGQCGRERSGIGDGRTRHAGRASTSASRCRAARARWATC